MDYELMVNGNIKTKIQTTVASNEPVELRRLILENQGQEEEILEKKKKISQSNKGNNPWKNKTEEEKNKIRQKLSKAHLDLNIKGGNHPNSKSIICLTTKKIFLSATEGSEYYNCDTSGIIKCCKRKNKSCGKINGYKLVWRYLVWEHKKYYKIKKEG